MEVGREKLASWPSEKLAVHAEHSSLFFDIMTDQIVDQVRTITCWTRLHMQGTTLSVFKTELAVP